MQLTPEELDHYLDRIAEGKAECRRLQDQLRRKEEECERLKQQCAALNEHPEPAADGGDIRIDVDALKQLMADMNDFQTNSFVLACLMKVMTKDSPRATILRIIESLQVKKKEGVNVHAEGDLNIEKFQNDGTVLAAKHIAC